MGIIIRGKGRGHIITKVAKRDTLEQGQKTAKSDRFCHYLPEYGKAGAYHSKHKRNTRKPPPELSDKTPAS